MPFEPVNNATPGFEPVNDATPGFEPIEPKPSFKDKALAVGKKGLGLAKDYILGNLTYKASKTALKTANKIDAPIEKFRSETLPDIISPTEASIEAKAAQSGKVPYLDIAKRTAAYTVGNVAIPTTKEVIIGAITSPFIKPAIGLAAKGLEEISPRFAASQTVKREVAALGRIQGANLSQPALKSTAILQGAKKLLSDTPEITGPVKLTPAVRNTAGEIEVRPWGHKEYTKAGDLVPGQKDLENGFVNQKGDFVTLKEMGKIAKETPVGQPLPFNDPEFVIKPSLKDAIQKSKEAHGFIKQTVGDISVPPELEQNTSGLPSTKRSFTADLAKQILPEETALRKQGKHGGKLANDAMHYVQDSQIMAAKAQTKILPDLMSVPEEIRNKIPDYIEPRPGQDRPILAGQAKVVADKVKKQLQVWGRFLESQDIEVIRNGQPSKFMAKNEFFPRALDVEAVSKDKALYNSELDNLVKTKQVSSPEEAKQVLDAAIKTKSSIFAPKDFTNFSGIRKVSTIEKPRIYTFKNVTNDPVENLVGYFNNVSRRVNEIKYFGQHSELLHERLASIGNEGGDANFAQGVMSRLLRQNQQDEAGNYVVRQLRAFQGATKLSRSAIPNLQQGVVNSYIRAQSESAVLKGFKNSFTEEGVNFARKAGIISNQETDQYLEHIAGMRKDINATSVEKLSETIGKWSGFKKSEELNRVQAANIGREYISEVAQKFLENPDGKIGTKTLRDELKAFRVNVENLSKRGHLTFNEELKAANIFTGETQFGTRPLSMPAIYNSSSAGKLAGQFSMFPIQQGRLTTAALKQHPLKTGPIIGATSIGIGGTLGMAANMAAGKAPVDKKSTPAKTLGNYVLNSVLQSGALGKLGGVYSGAQYGPEAVMSQMVGPTITEAGKLGYNAALAAKGKPKQLIKQGLKQIPFIGTASSNLLIPAKKKK